MFSLLRNLLAPEKLMEQSSSRYDEKNTLNPIIAERFHFYRRDQQTGESISEYLAELRKLATHCHFKADLLEEALQDRFVCGLRREATQRRLLLEADLTLNKALELANSFETVEQEAKQLRGAGQQVHHVSHKTCYRCNGKGHGRKYRDYNCKQCHMPEGTPG